jgi:hypothetical protein
LRPQSTTLYLKIDSPFAPSLRNGFADFAVNAFFLKVTFISIQPLMCKIGFVVLLK